MMVVALVVAISRLCSTKVHDRATSEDLAFQPENNQ